MSQENNEKEKKKSVIETMRELDAADRKAAIAEEAAEALERAKKDDRKRRAYEEKLRQEKLELMKLKAGMISEEDIPKEEQEKREYTIWEKISNFFYHNKAYVIVGVLLTALAAFLIYDYASTVRPDIQALYIAPDFDMSYYTDTASGIMSVYGQDYNKDGKSVFKLYYVPTGYADDTSASMYLAQGDRTKLLGEFQSGNSIIIIGTKEAFQSLGALEGVFADCRSLFPGDPYAEELGYRLAGTDFKEMIDRPDMDDSELYVSFRTPIKTMGLNEDKMRENYNKSVLFWTNFLSEHRVDGLTLPDVPDPEPLPDYYDPAYYGDIESEESDP
ncbi:MAG: hypothetical protein K2N72_11590 [Oscillospiraceae bacterium]|nr:hypothetical protein [Oscillospiraceae bacterium]